MTRHLVFVFALLTTITVLGTESSSPSAPSDPLSRVTFHKDVLPILQNNCQVCHRPGGAAPMSFLTYESTRPWAKAIKAAVVGRKMPPWFADPQYGEFRNAPKLVQQDIATLTAWADNGAREGDPSTAPPARRWVDGWKIQPDVIVSMPEPYPVAARGAGEIKHFVIPNPFKEDTWVTSIEIRPGDPSVVHHVLLQMPEQSGKVVKRALLQCDTCPQPEPLQRQAGIFQEAILFSPRNANLNINDGPQDGGSYSSDSITRIQERLTGRGTFTTMEAVYAPGSQPLDFRFNNAAKLIRGGVPIRLEVHYTPNGKQTFDKTMVGFTLAKSPAQRRFVIMAPEHMVDSRRPIPAGAADWETRGELTFNLDADLVWFMPHMHLRGKDMTFRLIYPDGREQTVLSAKFNFNWQLGYEVKEPIHVPKGTRMIVTAHHDNSANNAMNPAPDREVRWGEMTSDEMMLPWFGVVVDGNVAPELIASYRPGDFNAPAGPAFIRGKTGSAQRQKNRGQRQKNRGQTGCFPFSCEKMGNNPSGPDFLALGEAQQLQGPGLWPGK